MEDLFGSHLPGRNLWRGAGKPMRYRLTSPLHNIPASNDRITPAATAPEGRAIPIDSGHVGMIVGSARAKLHEALADFLGK
jgi:hypothetical protein